MFLVDASGSMALHRMAAAKSAPRYDSSPRATPNAIPSRSCPSRATPRPSSYPRRGPSSRRIVDSRSYPAGAVRPRARSRRRGESRGQRREDEGRSERRARGAHHRRRRERRSRSVASNVERAVSSGGVRPLEGGAAGRGGGRGEAFGTRGGSAFGGGHGESVRGWRADGRGAVEPREGRRARGGREVSQDADGRGPARERRGALVVSVGLSARAPFHHSQTAERPRNLFHDVSRPAFPRMRALDLHLGIRDGMARFDWSRIRRAARRRWATRSRPRSDRTPTGVSTVVSDSRIRHTSRHHVRRRLHGASPPRDDNPARAWSYLRHLFPEKRHRPDA